MDAPGTNGPTYGTRHAAESRVNYGFGLFENDRDTRARGMRCRRSRG